MTTGAARALREVIGPILVAAEADLALGGGRIFVATVAGRARAVLGLRVQARKLRDLVTRRAGRDTCRSLGAVRSMAGRAPAADAAVGALLLFSVAVGADFLRR